MAVEVAKSDILDALTYTSVEEEPRWNYSGRGMYGVECFGFVGTMEDYGNFLIGLLNTYYDQTEDIEAATTLVGYFAERVQTDNMGRSTIFYFPYLTILEED